MKQGDYVCAEWERNGKRYTATGHYAHTDPLGGVWLTTAEIDNGTIIRRVPTTRVPTTRKATLTILEAS